MDGPRSDMISRQLSIFAQENGRAERMRGLGARLVEVTELAIRRIAGPSGYAAKRMKFRPKVDALVDAYVPFLEEHVGEVATLPCSKRLASSLMGFAEQDQGARDRLVEELTAALFPKHDKLLYASLEEASRADEHEKITLMLAYYGMIEGADPGTDVEAFSQLVDLVRESHIPEAARESFDGWIAAKRDSGASKAREFQARVTFLKAYHEAVIGSELRRAPLARPQEAGWTEKLVGASKKLLFWTILPAARRTIHAQVRAGFRNAWVQEVGEHHDDPRYEQLFEAQWDLISHALYIAEMAAYDISDTSIFNYLWDHRAQMKGDRGDDLVFGSMQVLMTSLDEVGGPNVPRAIAKVLEAVDGQEATVDTIDHALGVFQGALESGDADGE